ncbi:MAG: alpha/beta fold hydrolase [Acidimicrobiia bacterium]|nr:alpha/beta fold hydrolase [Acidimicrobiia bacterium]
MAPCSHPTCWATAGRRNRRAIYSSGTYATFLRDLLVALDLERATVVGQSLGGGIAMQLAYQHPECCERLALVGSGGLGREVSWILRALAVPGAEYAMPALFPGVTATPATPSAASSGASTSVHRGPRRCGRGTRR